MLGVTEGVHEVLGVCDGVRELDAVTVLLGVSVDVGVAACVPVAVEDGVVFAEAVPDTLGVPEGVTLGVGAGVADSLDVPDTVEDGVAVAEAVPVLEGDRVREGVWVSEREPEGVRVDEGVKEAVCDGVWSVRLRMGVDARPNCEGAREAQNESAHQLRYDPPNDLRHPSDDHGGS